MLRKTDGELWIGAIVMVVIVVALMAIAAPSFFGSHANEVHWAGLDSKAAGKAATFAVAKDCPGIPGIDEAQTTSFARSSFAGKHVMAGSVAVGGHTIKAYAWVKHGGLLGPSHTYVYVSGCGHDQVVDTD